MDKPRNDSLFVHFASDFVDGLEYHSPIAFPIKYTATKQPMVMQNPYVNASIAVSVILFMS